MKYKPIDIPDNFGDTTLSCGNCYKPIIFPLIRNPWHIYDKRPNFCEYCKAEIDWNDEDD